MYGRFSFDPIDPELDEADVNDDGVVEELLAILFVLLLLLLFELLDELIFFS